MHVSSVNVLQLEPPAAAFLGGVALEDVPVNHEAGTDAIAKPRRAVNVDCGAAFCEDPVDIDKTVRALTFDDGPTAIGGQRRVDALIEDEPVVFNVAIPAESKVREAAAVTTAQIAAHPIVVEFVVVGSRADGYAAG